MVIDIVRLGPVIGTQRNRRGAPTEYGSSPRCIADRLGITRPIDNECAVSPDLLKLRPMLCLRQSLRVASGIRKAHFLRVYRRMLGLLGIRALQLVPG